MKLFHYIYSFLPTAPISINEELQHLHQEYNMEKQRIFSLIAGEYTLAEDIADSTDGNDVGNPDTMEEIDTKISRAEQLRTSYSCIMS